MERSRKFPFFVGLALCLVALVCTVTADVWAQEDMKSIASSVNAFSFDLYMKCRKPNENLFLSPYSAAVALTMAYAGARGETESQMARVLHYTPGQGNVHKAMGDLQRTILSAGDGGPTLNPAMALWQKILGLVEPGRPTVEIANALWGQQGYKFEEPSLSLLKQNYGRSLRTVDFEGNPRGAAAEINEWASHQTRGRITKIVDPSTFSHMTRLILASAVYFKGLWVSPFKTGHTIGGKFTLPDGTKRMVNMMYQGAAFPYAEYNDSQVIELPYEEGALSMVVFLPRYHDALQSWEESLNLDRLREAMTILRSTQVKLFLPRFKLIGSYSLSNTSTFALDASPATDQVQSLLHSDLDNFHDKLLRSCIETADAIVDDRQNAYERVG